MVAAIKLTDIAGIYIDDQVTEVEYFHFICAHHEIVNAESAATETLLTGQEALRKLSPAALQEIYTIFPDLRQSAGTVTPARLIPNNKRQNHLAQRHRRNQHPLYTPSGYLPASYAGASSAVMGTTHLM